MISFSLFDIIIIVLFFSALLIIGFLSSRKVKSDAESFLLSGRNMGLILFVLVNVSTWYGGIIGVGEFTYRYGLVSWFTQGLPYYFFAFLFAMFFAKKIREASLFTIPEKLEQVYGKNTALLSAVVVFILVSPAPYLLMSANLISLVFDTGDLISLLIGIILSASYLVKGGFRSNIFTDAFQFFIMFAGFIVILLVAALNFGGINFLKSNLPHSHISLTGDASVTFLIVWFLIALWTFADPGFHQRSYSAKTGNVAKYGILISIIFWALFDFLTTSTGLYAKAIIPDLENPIMAYPVLAEKILAPGLKGIFYAAMFATIISTLNSFMFLSATTIGKDFIYRLSKEERADKIKFYTIIGVIITSVLSVIIAYTIPSVVQIWYTIGSLFIPGIILPVISAYYPRIIISNKIIMVEIVLAVLSGTIWLAIRNNFHGLIYEIEPMLIGVTVALLIHFTGLICKSFSFNK
ncbi:MAG: sodium:solute symporter family protein [Ignavibacteriales bacterium]|jgi:SSS family solute:Na+ symporter|nr:sodium:solute symporter family protein [Ignavibacteriaceae bacterium]MEB2353782.1 sodium:solute symporter family protein [Ignavibacteriales bacterium]